MRIYDEKNDQELHNVTLYLTPDEALELSSRCNYLAEHPEAHHSHCNDFDYTREITVTVYTAQNIEQFDNRSREIIGDDWQRPSTGAKILSEAHTIPISDSEQVNSDSKTTRKLSFWKRLRRRT